MKMMADSNDDAHKMSMVTLVTAMIYHPRHLSLGNVVLVSFCDWTSDILIQMIEDEMVIMLIMIMIKAMLMNSMLRKNIAKGTTDPRVEFILLK